MEKYFEGLSSKKVFQYFEEISKIPRGSGNEKAISDYLVKFAREHDLEVTQDESFNVIIKKPASLGFENVPGVIIQGHMDMVCDKNKGVVHDFERDPIKLQVKDGMIYASGTTLGGDDGIAIAYALALLDSDDIPHPPLEVLLTTGEEVGLTGAARVDLSSIKGKYLINLDSEEEGRILSGCAGGVRAKIYLPVLWEDADKALIPYKITIGNLKGGHSGGEIDKERANSHKLMGRLLYDMSLSMNFYINRIDGGQKMNAIPRETSAVILISHENSEKLAKKAAEWDGIFKNEYRASDKNVTVTAEKLDMDVDNVFTKSTARSAIGLLLTIPNGIQSMSMEIKGLPESSTNIGVVETSDKNISYESAVRSSVRSRKYYICTQMKVVAEKFGADIEFDGDYPEWEYNPDSSLRKLFIKVYKDIFGRGMEVIATHGGVECGLFKEKLQDVDMVSLGPDIYGVHTPDEHLSIASVQRTWELLLEVLKEIKDIK